MRKYLMTGVAAIALCAAFTSCSKNEELYNPEVVKGNEATTIVEKYNQAFTKYVGGTISPDQTWGFGGYSAGTRAENPDANKWAADGYKAPTELSAQQKIRVMAYFQANPGLTYVDPGFKDFFVQQVYKGGTTPGAISAEVYHATNGNEIVGSEHMDWLYMGLEGGQPRQHINNFNHGRYGTANASDPNGLPRENVQNWPDITYLNDNGDGTHKDHIMLILGESTETVGFQDSEGSKIHLDCCANAGAAVIDAWAIAHQDSLTKIGKFGATVTDDRWNRSFVGLDYEQVTIAGLLTGSKAKALDFCDGNSQYVLYKGKMTPKSEFQDFVLTDAKGNELGYVTDNVANQAIANYIKDGNNNVTKDTYNKKLTKDQFNSQYGITITNSEAGYYNLDLVLGYILQSAHPTQNNGNWVKNIGGRDYVFSDWIVTLTEANKENIVTPPSDPDDVCIIAEDLSAADDTDFDFNDVVFTVEYTNETSATVTIYAAGGTLPLKVDGKEVHGLLGYGTPDSETGKYKMINTGAKADVNDVPTYSFTVTNIQKSKRGNDIKIEVDKGSKNEEGVHVPNWIELTAQKGTPAAKLCVGVDFATGKKWCAERESIKTKYPVFSQWVASNPAQIWWY
jgi:hypothetical protein